MHQAACALHMATNEIWTHWHLDTLAFGHTAAIKVVTSAVSVEPLLFLASWGCGSFLLEQKKSYWKSCCVRSSFVSGIIWKVISCLQEPELLEQLYLGMATYDGVGHMRLCSALRRGNRIRKGTQAGSSSGAGSSSSHASLISDNTEVVQLLVRASEQYAQVRGIGLCMC